MEIRDRNFVIVGASQAGAVAAGALRGEGFDGRITLVGAEPYLPVAADVVLRSISELTLPVVKGDGAPAADDTREETRTWRWRRAATYPAGEPACGQNVRRPLGGKRP